MLFMFNISVSFFIEKIKTASKIPVKCISKLKKRNVNIIKTAPSYMVHSSEERHREGVSCGAKILLCLLLDNTKSSKTIFQIHV